jgi:hypothetical protein
MVRSLVDQNKKLKAEEKECMPSVSKDDPKGKKIHRSD